MYLGPMPIPIRRPKARLKTFSMMFGSRKTGMEAAGAMVTL